MASGEEVYAGEYLPCGGRSPLPVSTIALVPPADSVDMWIADKRLAKLAPIGALRDGNVLLPVTVLDRCENFRHAHR